MAMPRFAAVGWSRLRPRAPWVVCLSGVAALSLPAVARTQVTKVTTPAAAGSAEPNLSVLADGKLLLSWIEPHDSEHRLAFSTNDAAGWSAPRTVARGDNWFVNWADFPSVVGAADGSLLAHWLVRSAEGTYDYDVTMSRSKDGGATWGEPFVPHRDGVAAEHGFVSLLPLSSGGSVAAAFWLDGRELAKDRRPRGSMTLRYAELTAAGKVANSALLDARVCECCQTSAAMTSVGPIVVYRDRSDEEVRDVFCVRQVDGKWRKPHAVHVDGWKVSGCPVNGPSVAADGNRVAVAWYTAANGAARVFVAFSNDAGATFEQPVLVDGRNPTGRVEIAIGADEDAYVCWLATREEGATIRCCRVRPDGPSDPFDVAKTSAARSSGFPQLVWVRDKLWFAWTAGAVRSAFVNLPLRDG